MEEIEYALKLVRMGKPLTAINFIKQFLRNNPDKIENNEECKAISNIILHFPSLNDESWRYFVHIEKDDAEILIEKIKECLRI
ncbi:hypothetical protein [Sulfurisphaera ohwakuensis]|uniref:hypothetical protein n=1 Tax=Sulfurisphaera ohwakuensis TaxID=69656 RepID=UPI0036F2D94E